MGYYVDGIWHGDSNHYEWPYPGYDWNRRQTRNTFTFEMPMTCPQCGAQQKPSEMHTVEIEEPGKNSRVEFHGKIRPTYSAGFVYYSCLVCGHTWGGPERTPPGGASVEFLHPVLEVEDELEIDRDAC